MLASYHDESAPILSTDSTNNALDAKERDPNTYNALPSPPSVLIHPYSTSTNTSHNRPSITDPPSSTRLNASSLVHCQTSVALRDNKPDGHSSCKPSTAIFQFDSTQLGYHFSSSSSSSSSYDTDHAQQRTTDADMIIAVGDREDQLQRKSKRRLTVGEESQRTVYAQDMEPAEFGVLKKTSSSARPTLPKREPTIDEVTQVIDLTSEIIITHPTPVSYGGFSLVYKGEWERNHDAPILASSFQNIATKIQVAVKLLRVQTPNVELAVRARKRLNREVNIWKRLDHPNIARFYGISFQFDGRPALIIQWYSNGTAPEFIKDRSKEYKLNFMKEISRGLSYLHALQPPVAHGDLKGSNILVDDDGHAVLTDFGLAKLLEEFGKPTGNTTSTTAGSVRWQAPELLLDDDNEDEAVNEDNPPSRLSTPTLSSDVWSFGCTTYELMTGNLPYCHRTRDWRVGEDIVEGITPLRPNDIIIHESEALLGILHDCWKLTPSDRPSMENINSRLGGL